MPTLINVDSLDWIGKWVTYHLLCFAAFPVAFWCCHLEPAEFVFASLSEFPAPAEKGKREGKGTHVNEMNGKSLIIKVKVVQSIPAVVCTQWVEILSEGAFSKFWFLCNFIFTWYIHKTFMRSKLSLWNFDTVLFFDTSPYRKSVQKYWIPKQSIHVS